jgi:AmmeMemoRadiSam system protein A
MSPSSTACSLSPAAQRALLDLARDSIRFGLLHGKPCPVNSAELPSELIDRRATFVTLQKNGELRGCIGSLEATRALAVDIASNAFAAAFRDPRFPPVTSGELGQLVVHLSLLTPAELMDVASEEDLIRQIEPGKDGLILEDGSRRSTFLPAVWESLPDARQFLQQLRRKAGLPADYWSDTIQFSRYRAETVD